MPRFKYDHKKYDNNGMKCPVCDYTDTSYYRMAEHIATKGNKQPYEAHRKWRLKNRIQADYNYDHEKEHMITKIKDKLGYG